MRDEKWMVTIVIPAYNVEAYIDRCLASVAAQTYKNILILVVDDGSSDKTPQILKDWARKDGRIRVVTHEHNKGLAEARNTALRETGTELIFWVDADDWIEPCTIEKVMDTMETYDADIVRTEFHAPLADEITVLDHDGYLKPLLQDRFKSYMAGTMFWTILFDGIPFPKGSFLEDYMVHPYVADRVGTTVVISKEYYHVTEMRTGSITQTTGRMLSGLFEREQAAFKRYSEFVRRYPDACSVLLSQAASYACICFLLSYKSVHEKAVRCRCDLKDHAAEIEKNRYLSAYKKHLCKLIINKSGLIPIYSLFHRAKRKLVGAR